MRSLPEGIEIDQILNLAESKLHEDFDSEVEVTHLQEGERIESFATNHATGSLVVFYDGSKHSDQEQEESLVIQDVEMRIGVYMQLRIEHGFSLRNSLVTRIKKSLAGLRYKCISRAEKMKPDNDEYIAPETEGQLMFIEHVVLFNAPTEFIEENFKQYNQ